MTPNANENPPRGDKKKRAPRVGRLDTVGFIITEMGRLYRLARRGEIESADASRLASILALMRQGLEASELEKQLADLRALVDGSKNSGNSPPRPVTALRPVTA